jgi:hypothetical protein
MQRERKRGGGGRGQGVGGSEISARLYHFFLQNITIFLKPKTQNAKPKTRHPKFYTLYSKPEKKSEKRGIVFRKNDFEVISACTDKQYHSKLQRVVHV